MKLIASNGNKISKNTAARAKSPQQTKQAKCSTQNKLQKMSIRHEKRNKITHKKNSKYKITQNQKEKQATTHRKQKTKPHNRTVAAQHTLFAQFENQTSNTSCTRKKQQKTQRKWQPYFHSIILSRGPRKNNAATLKHSKTANEQMQHKHGHTAETTFKKLHTTNRLHEDGKFF